MKLVAILNLIDKNISNVFLGLNPNINNNQNLNNVQVRKKDLSRSIPLNSFGNGIKKIFNIVCSIVNNSDGILLIDELENGLYYSIIPKLWEFIYELATDYNCQLIATTHSIEMVDATLDIKKFNDKNFTYIKIFDDNGLISEYSYSDLQSSKHKNLEIR